MSSNEELKQVVGEDGKIRIVYSFIHTITLKTKPSVVLQRLDEEVADLKVRIQRFIDKLHETK